MRIHHTMQAEPPATLYLPGLTLNASRPGDSLSTETEEDQMDIDYEVDLPMVRKICEKVAREYGQRVGAALRKALANMTIVLDKEPDDWDQMLERLREAWQALTPAEIAARIDASLRPLGRDARIDDLVRVLAGAGVAPQRAAPKFMQLAYAKFNRELCASAELRTPRLRPTFAMN